jgi:hypothetical protein
MSSSPSDFPSPTAVAACKPILPPPCPAFVRIAPPSPLSQDLVMPPSPLSSIELLERHRSRGEVMEISVLLVLKPSSSAMGASSSGGGSARRHWCWSTPRTSATSTTSSGMFPTSSSSSSPRRSRSAPHRATVSPSSMKVTVTPRISKPHDYANHMFMRL